MVTKSSDILGGRHPATLPLYSLREAAHWLALPIGTVRNWCLGRAGRGGQSGFKAVLDIADPAEKTLSFQNLVELHVLGILRDRHGMSLQSVRRAVRFLEDKLGVEHPLANSKLSTDGIDVLVDQFDRLVNASRGGQLEMRPLVTAYLRRIEYDAKDGLPTRLFPFTRGFGAEDVRSVAIDPRIQFGRPCILRRGVPTDAIVDRWRGGDSIRALADDFACSQEEIEEALRYEIHERKVA